MPHPHPEMVAIWQANKEHVTAAAIFEGGEVTSGSLPGDDYKLAWIDLENHLNAGKIKAAADAAAKNTPKSWVKYIR